MLLKCNLTFLRILTCFCYLFGDQNFRRTNFVKQKALKLGLVLQPNNIKSIMVLRSINFVSKKLLFFVLFCLFILSSSVVNAFASGAHNRWHSDRGFDVPGGLNFFLF